jgi:hypothetical protein
VNTHCIETRNSEGNLLSREDYEDYRAVDGIQFPFTTRKLDQDQTEIVIKYAASITDGLSRGLGPARRPACGGGTGRCPF